MEWEWECEVEVQWLPEIPGTSTIKVAVAGGRVLARRASCRAHSLTPWLPGAAPRHAKVTGRHSARNPMQQHALKRGKTTRVIQLSNIDLHSFCFVVPSPKQEASRHPGTESWYLYKGVWQQHCRYYYIKCYRQALSSERHRGKLDEVY